MKFNPNDILQLEDRGRQRTMAKVLTAREWPASVTGEWYTVQWEDGSIEGTCGEGLKVAPFERWSRYRVIEPQVETV